MKTIYIITGGTMVHVTPHFSLCAPAYGQVGAEIYERLSALAAAATPPSSCQVHLIKTRMAGRNHPETIAHLAALGAPTSPETNHDLGNLVDALLRSPDTSGLIMAAAICDFQPEELTATGEEGFVTMLHFGKDQERLHHVESLMLKLQPSEKIIDRVKKVRPEMRLVTFKTTAGMGEEALFRQARYNLQRSQSDMVFANDIQHHLNLVVTAQGERLRGADRKATIDLFCQHFWEMMNG